MFKYFYTTRMSDDGKVLKRRFKNILSDVSERSKIAAVICVIAFVTVIGFCAVTLSRIGEEGYKVDLGVDNGIFDDMTLTIYYTRPPFNLTRYPWSVDNLKEFCDLKIVVDSNKLKEHIDLLKKMENVSLQAVEDDSYLDCRVYYIFESAEKGKLLDVSLSTSSGCMIVNGEKVKPNYEFKKVIAPFLPEEDGLIWRGYIAPLSAESLQEMMTETTINNVINRGVDITCNGRSVVLENKPFYYDGDIYVPLEELFKRVSTMTYSLGHFVEYDGEKIHLTYQDESGNMRKFEMKTGKKMITGDNEFMPVTEPFNAPVWYNEVVYIPMEYVYSMFFYETEIDYRITGDNEFVKKLDGAIEFEEEAHRWAPPGFTQYDLNMKANEAYENWNKLLDEIMAELTDEEYKSVNHEAWLEVREDYMDNESSPNAGGSMQPMVRAYAGAHLTRKRCEQLLVEYVLR